MGYELALIVLDLISIAGSVVSILGVVVVAWRMWHKLPLFK